MSSKRTSRKDKLRAAAAVVATPEEQEAVTKDIESSWGRTPSSKKTQAAQTMVQEEYEFLLRESGVNPWEGDFVENTKKYLSFYVRNVQGGTGRIGQNVKIGSLISRLHHLKRLAHWRIDDFYNLIPKFDIHTKAHVHWLAEKYELETEALVKSYCGLDELSVLYTAIGEEEDANSQNLVQHLVAWQIFANTGVRSGSLGYTDQYKLQYIKWEDIVVELFLDHGVRRIRIQLTIEWIKGHRDRNDVAYKRNRFIKPTFLFYPVSHPSLLPADLTITIVLLGIQRGVFRGISSYEELMSSPIARISMNPTMTKHPVFLSHEKTFHALSLSDPLPATGFLRPLKRIAQKAGIIVRISPHSFRRDTLTSLNRTHGKELGQQVLSQAPSGQSYAAYDFGIGDLDIIAARHAPEGERSRISNRKDMMPSVIHRADDANAFAAHRYVFVESEIRKKNDFWAVEEAYAVRTREALTALQIPHDDLSNVLSTVQAVEGEPMGLWGSQLAGLLEERRQTRSILRQRAAKVFDRRYVSNLEATMSVKQRQKNKERARILPSYIEGPSGSEALEIALGVGGADDIGQGIAMLEAEEAALEAVLDTDVDGNKVGEILVTPHDSGPVDPKMMDLARSRAIKYISDLLSSNAPSKLACTFCHTDPTATSESNAQKRSAFNRHLSTDLHSPRCQAARALDKSQKVAEDGRCVLCRRKVPKRGMAASHLKEHGHDGMMQYIEERSTAIGALFGLDSVLPIFAAETVEGAPRVNAAPQAHDSVLEISQGDDSGQ